MGKVKNEGYKRCLPIVNLLWPLFIFSACGPCYDYTWFDYTHYTIIQHEKSALGYGIDDPEHQLDLARLDHVVKDVSACTGVEIRPCLTIKAAPDWHWESAACQAKTSVQDNNQPQQLFGSAPAASCLAKGESPDPECPCQFRAIIQDNCSVVTTPDMEILAGQLTSLFTGDSDPWGDSLAACAKVSISGGE